MGSGSAERRGWDSNPRATFRPPTVFKTAPFDRSGTPPWSIVADVRHVLGGLVDLRETGVLEHAP